MLEISGIATSYGKIEALRGVDLTVEEGKISCLLGPNGAGKTTLMMTITGLLQAHRGSVRFEGQELVGLSPVKIVKAGIALVPQNRLVFADMSTHENLIAGAYVRLGHSKADVDADIERAYVRFPRLKGCAGQPAGTLSGGEQQMLSVARALMTRPKLLLMDEPSLGLAPMIVAEIFQIIRDLHADGTTIFLVEQNAHMALQVADHFNLLDQGRVTFSGTPGEVAEEEVIRRAYLGSSQSA